MKRFLVAGLLILTLIFGAYSLNQYWIHRYDALIAREAAIYRVDPIWYGVSYMKRLISVRGRQEKTARSD